MITLDGMVFLATVAMPIMFLSLIICSYIYLKFYEKKPVLSLVVCGVIVIVALYAIYFLRVYGADVGWFPPIGSNEMTNLTLNNVVG